MKRLFLFLALSLGLFLRAEEATGGERPAPSLPPYQVGALPLASGLTIVRADQPDLNLRFVDNRMRLYWIDDEGLVTEPDATEVSVRFTRSLRGPNFHRLVRLGNEAGFGTPHIVPLPHIYNGILILTSAEGGEPQTHAFRYTAEMDAVAESPAP